MGDFELKYKKHAFQLLWGGLFFCLLGLTTLTSAAETQTVPEASAAAETPAEVEKPGKTEARTVPETPAAAETPTMLQSPTYMASPTVQEMPEAAETPEVQTAPETPAATEASAVPEMPAGTEVQAEEIIFVEQDGVVYYHGNRNYPVWSMGKRVGAVADLSSAYILDDNGKWKLIGFLSFPIVVRQSGSINTAVPLEEEWRECCFWQKVKTGEFFFFRDGIVGNKVEGKAFARELSVYKLLSESAEYNMAAANG